MNTSSIDVVDKGVDYWLDITADVCPLTFVKTKLLIERMKPGETAEVMLAGAEPLENVPRSVAEHGHTVLVLAPVASVKDSRAVHRLVIRKEKA
jgi:tRNA 2-thiouridine synthesizing protein A